MPELRLVLVDGVTGQVEAERLSLAIQPDLVRPLGHLSEHRRRHHGVVGKQIAEQIVLPQVV